MHEKHVIEIINEIINPPSASLIIALAKNIKQITLFVNLSNIIIYHMPTMLLRRLKKKRLLKYM